MTIYYLYVKTHRITGLKYLGQTKHDPHNYKGSGTDWKQHIATHGNNVITEILLETTSKEERNVWGRYYSKLWNIVHGQDDFGNKIWANKIPETGGGGIDGSINKGNIPWNKGKTDCIKQTIESNTARSTTLKGRPSPNKGNYGSLNPFYGRKHTEESINKIKDKIKNRVPWNKGKKGVQTPWNKGTTGLQTAWNKGLTKT